MTWRELPPQELDRALAFLRAQGYRPYALLETWEQADYVSRFGGQSPLGQASVAPVADINHEAKIYDFDDYARYRAGSPVRPDAYGIASGPPTSRFRSRTMTRLSH